MYSKYCLLNKFIKFLCIFVIMEFMFVNMLLNILLNMLVGRVNCWLLRFDLLVYFLFLILGRVEGNLKWENGSWKLRIIDDIFWWWFLIEKNDNIMSGEGYYIYNVWGDMFVVMVVICFIIWFILWVRWIELCFVIGYFSGRVR